jgi:hypothetical protein
VLLACGIGAVGLCLAVRSAIAAPDTRWPPFLPPRDGVPDAGLVERVWNGETFRRTLSPPPVAVPLALYAALIDAPDVMAAAARHLGNATETVAPLPDGSWEIVSTKGSRAVYRVLRSAPDRRVVLSHGHVLVLGFAVPGSVLGVLDLRERGASVEQRLTVHARIDHAAWALLTRFLLALLPSLADAELARGFRITAAVAAWARQDGEAFCAWLRSSGRETPGIASAAGCPPESPRVSTAPRAQ